MKNETIETSLNYIRDYRRSLNEEIVRAQMAGNPDPDVGEDFVHLLEIAEMLASHNEAMGEIITRQDDEINMLRDRLRQREEANFQNSYFKGNHK